MKSQNQQVKNQNSVEVQASEFSNVTPRSTSISSPGSFLAPDSSVKGIGIDIVPISRIANIITRYDRETLSLLFTANEINQCQKAKIPHKYYAVCFATKESVGKALGTGLADIGWNEIEAQVTDTKLSINLFGEASRQASLIGVREWLATWCCWDDYVMVHVLAQ